jgi:Berberine and berberine like
VVHEFMADAPDEIGAVSVLRLAPPMPFLPAEQYGKPVIGVVPAYVGDPAAGEKALQPIRSVGTPIADAVRPVPYLFLQTLFDGGLLPGMHYYLKSNLLKDLPDEVIDLLVAHAGSVTSPLSAIRLHWINGEARRIDPQSTATTGRDAALDINFTSAWSPLAPEAEPHVRWARDGWEALQPHVMGIMPQFVTDEAREGVESVYGSKLERLVALKDRWDSTNFFRLNQNIRPSAAG